MTEMTIGIAGGADQIETEGTVLRPKFYEGPSEALDDIYLHQRFFTYRSDAGLISGKTFKVRFVVDRPASAVWPYLKDMNLWQNPYGQYYSGIVGDLEGETVRVSGSPNDQGPHLHRVLRVIPEFLIIVSRTASAEEEKAGIRPDYYMFILDEHEKKTTVTVLTGRACLCKDEPDEKALLRWREMAKESHCKFRDAFIPELKKLVYESR